MPKLKYNRSCGETAQKLIEHSINVVKNSSDVVDYKLARKLAIGMASSLSDVYYDLKHSKDAELDKFCVDMHLYFKKVKDKLINLDYEGQP